MFEKRLSHTADSQDQRHRMVPASRPLMTFADTRGARRRHAAADRGRTPRRAAVYRQRDAATRGRPRTACSTLGVPLEFALYVLPNAKALRLVESGRFIALQHKWTLRTCFNAQEEIYLASMDEIAQVRAVHPRLGTVPRPAVRAAQPDRRRRGAPRARTSAACRCGTAFPDARAAAVAGRRDADLPWLAHLYTATGAVLALLAPRWRCFGGDFRAAFFWLAAATFVDATDGVLARALRGEGAPARFDGATLDDIVDYLTYVFVPVLLVWQAGLRAAAVALWIGAAMLLSSAYGFGRADAKVETTDHFFTGFPSYWNIVALYLYVWRLPPAVNAAILLVLAVLVFVPDPVRLSRRARSTLRVLDACCSAALWGAWCS